MANIIYPQSPFLDPLGRPSREWAQWLQNPNVVTLTAVTFSVENIILTLPLLPIYGGTGITTIPTNGQLLIGNGTDYTLNTLTPGAGLTITNAAGSITPSITNTGVTAGSYGSASSVTTFTVTASGQLTVAGSVVIAIDTSQIISGILSIARGGTNSSSTPTNGGISYGTGAAYAFSAAGTINQVLLSNGAATPSWANQSSLAVGTATNLAGGAAGFIPYQTGAGLTTFLATGANGQVLTLALGVPSWSTPTTGTVTSVTGTAPIVSSGGATPAISIPAATNLVNGFLTSTDWTTFNSKGTVTSVAALTLGTTGTDLSSTVATGTTTPVITLQVPTASATNRGALNAADWATFNAKQPALGFTPVNKAGDTMTGQLNLVAGTATVAPLDFATGVNLTTPIAGCMEFDGTVPYFSVAASTRGAIASEQWVVLTGTNTLTSQTAVQPIFDGGGGSTNGAVTLPIGTYQFECQFALTGMSATSGSFGFGLAGAATKTFSYQSTSSKLGILLSTAMTTNQVFGTAAITALQTASVGTVGTALIKGIVRVTVAGTIIPQVSLTVAAAAVVQANSYFRISPIGSATVATLGNWS